MTIEGATLYERDFYGWTQQQAAALRQAATERPNTAAPVDWENLAQEVEDMGRSDLRELGSRLEVLLLHLLKWRHQPEQRTGGWAGSIVEQRAALRRLLRQSPGLKPHRVTELTEAYPEACRRAVAETGLPADTFPPACPFTLGESMDDAFWPDPAP